jgi:hypothetical protein
VAAFYLWLLLLVFSRLDCGKIEPVKKGVVAPRVVVIGVFVKVQGGSWPHSVALLAALAAVLAGVVIEGFGDKVGTAVAFLDGVPELVLVDES